MFTYKGCANSLRKYQNNHEKPLLKTWQNNSDNLFITELIQLCEDFYLKDKKQKILLKIDSILTDSTRFINPQLKAILSEIKEIIPYFPEDNDLPPSSHNEEVD